jgi:hypothetical protein
MSCQVPSNGGRCACFLGFNSHGYFSLFRSLCTDCRSSVLCRFLNVFIVHTALLKLSLLVAFLLITLISILIDFLSILAAHVRIASVTIIVTCSASIVVVVPEFGYQALDSKLLFDSCYRPSRDFRLAPPFQLPTNSEKRDRTWIFCTIRSDIPWLRCF